MKTIAKISSGEELDETGDLHITGNIEKGSSIHLSNGCLIIDGDVHDGASIKLSLDDEHIKKARNNGVKSYAGGRITVNEKGGINACGMVFDGSYPGLFTALLSGDLSKAERYRDKTNASRPPVKLLIKGRVHNGVTIDSDAPIEAQDVGMTCAIIGKHMGLKAFSLATDTVVQVSGEIIATQVGEKCQLTSNNGYIEVEKAEDKTKFTAKNSIQVTEVGDNVQLNSSKAYIKLAYAGDDINIIAAGNIDAQHLGHRATLQSTHKYIEIKEAGNHLNATAKGNIDVKTIGSHGTLRSENHHIDAQTIGAESVISAKTKIKAQSAHANVQMTAGSHIEITGTCPNPESLKLITENAAARITVTQHPELNTAPPKHQSSAATSRAKQQSSITKLGNVTFFGNNCIAVGDGVTYMDMGDPNGINFVSADGQMVIRGL